MSGVLGFLNRHKNKLMILGVVVLIFVVVAGVYVYWKGKREEEE